MKVFTKGQVTMIALIAIVIVGALVVYLIVRSQFATQELPSEVADVFSYYQECIQDEMHAAVSLAGTQGGWVYTPAYVPGSDYAPFSSQLNFLGFGVPYWLYVSQNGVLQTQVPSKTEIERQIGEYLSENIATCSFDSFYEQGYTISLTPARVEVEILDDEIRSSVTSPMSVTKGEVSAAKETHDVIIRSKFGALYETARAVYTQEQQQLLLENYTLDVLHSYAPVDGVELSCGHKIWKADEVIDTLQGALEDNIASLVFEGDGSSEREGYFVLPYDAGGATARVHYSPAWPSRISISGARGAVMMAEPVGAQEGLAAMGFCYAPYHFVYDISYPVLFQFSVGEELFQFGTVVIIDKNVARNAVESELGAEERVDICAGATQAIDVALYDITLAPVDGEVSYVCFDQRCDVGTTQGGVVHGVVPSCLNGYLQVHAEGYAPKEQLFSSNKESRSEVVLDKEYEVTVEIETGGKPLNGSAIVSFDGPARQTILLPETTEIDLSEGLYNISVYIYGNSTLHIPASTKTECHEVSRSGFLGMFGGTREECFDINLPATTIDRAVIGGGSVQTYLLASELAKGNLTLKASASITPTTLEQLQYVFEAVRLQALEVVSE